MEEAGPLSVSGESSPKRPRADPPPTHEEAAPAPAPPPPTPPQPPPPAGHHEGPHRAIRSLHDFIRRDVEPEGHRILLPYLSTRDRLRLSECSKGLLRYRSNLARIKVVDHPSVTVRLKRALVDLLQDQEAGHPVCLHIAHRDALALLAQLGWSCCAGLQVLDLSSMELRNKDAAHVGRGLMRGALQALEELVVAGESSGPGMLTPQGLRHLTAALNQGTCPQLRRLMVSNSYGSEEGFSQAIALAFESGRCAALQDLDIINTFLGPQGPSAIATALQAGVCPDLRRLSLSKCDLLPADGQTLGQALTSGGCPRLESLILRHNPRLGQDGLVSIMGSLQSGGCPGLRRLDLSCIVAPSEGGEALAQALSSGAVPAMQLLALGGAFRDREGVTPVLQAIKQGCCPDLRHLDLTTTKMDLEHGRILGEALAAGACPRLEDLMLSFNENLGDDGVVCVMEALEGGSCLSLRRLDFINTTIGQAGISGLARALMTGALRNLQEFKLIDKQPMWCQTVPVIKALGAGACADLRLLVISFAILTDETGQALVEAIRDSPWTHLKVIKVWDQAPAHEAMCVMGVGSRQVRATGVTDLALRIPDPACLRHIARAFREGGTKEIQQVHINLPIVTEADRGALEELRAALEGRVQLVLGDSPPLRVFSSLQSIT